jgi:hypothetical protein
MARDFYIAPAGSGTSGTGTRANPIVGLSTINSNAIGATSGDRLILLNPSPYYEPLTIAASGLTIVSEDAIFDGSTDLNGSNGIKLQGSYSYQKVSNAPWYLADAGLNVWKKGVYETCHLLINGIALPRMSSSLYANSSATVLGAIQENEWTIITETLDTITRALYVRLPSGQTPSNVDIRASYWFISNAESWNGGMIFATGKTGITFEGQFTINNTGAIYYQSAPVWIDQCTDVSNKNGTFICDNTKDGIWITGGDRVRLNGTVNHCISGGGFKIAGSHPRPGKVGGMYTGTGELEVYNWITNYCGTIPETDIATGKPTFVGDFDGGVAVGWEGGDIAKIIIRDGVCNYGGPQYDVVPTGTTVSGSRGSAVFIGTTLAHNYPNIQILRNRGNSVNKRFIAFDCNYTNATIVGNFAKNMRIQPYAVSVSSSDLFQILMRSTSGVNGTTTIANNTIDGGVYARSAMRLTPHTSVTGHTYNIYNNITSNCAVQSGFTDYGNIWIETLNGSPTFNIDNNIFDRKGSVYGRKVAANAADLTAWRVLGYDLNGASGTVTIADDGSATAGTANPIGLGLKYWTQARPSDVNGEPLPDTFIDIGAVQSTANAGHPKNLINSANPSATLSELLSYTPAEVEVQLDKVTELDSRTDVLESTTTSTVTELTLAKSSIPSIFSGDKEATTVVASEFMADNLLKLEIRNVSLTVGAYVGIGIGQTLSESNASSGTMWVNRFYIPPNTPATIYMGTNTAYSWKTTSGTAILNITQCR